MNLYEPWFRAWLILAPIIGLSSYYLMRNSWRRIKDIMQGAPAAYETALRSRCGRAAILCTLPLPPPCFYAILQGVKIVRPIPNL